MENKFEPFRLVYDDHITVLRVEDILLVKAHECTTLQDGYILEIVTRTFPDSIYIKSVDEHAIKEITKWLNGAELLPKVVSIREKIK